MSAYLQDGRWPGERVAVRCAPPLGWVVPNVISPVITSTLGEEPPHFALRASAFLRHAEIHVHQDERLLWAGRVERVQPGRSARLSAEWARSVSASGGPVTISCTRARQRG